MRALYQLARVVLVGGCYVLFGLKVRHRELVPPRGGFVLTPTHRSIIDTFVSGSVTRRRVRFMGKKSLWANPVFGWLLTALGGFPVNRDAGTAAVKAALEVLEDGEPVVVFPEGTRRTGSRIEDLHQGAAYLAVKRGIPLVPIGIAGTEEVLSRGRTIPRLKRIAVVVGPPIHPRTTGHFVDRDEVRRLTAVLETELQRLFDEAGALVP